MIRNIKLLIEYEGTNYSGWQAQKNTTKTIQHILEKALKHIEASWKSTLKVGR